MNIVILGAPGAGKGTQAARLCRHYGSEHLATGDLLRAEIKNQTDIGKEISAIIEQGLLVPDETVIALISRRMNAAGKKGGFILDGFPRNLSQAEDLLKSGVHIDAAVEIQVEDEVIVQRLAGRRVCPACGATYHVESHQPEKDGICDKCGSHLQLRPDDKEETIRKRLGVYHGQTAPVTTFFTNHCGLITVHGHSDANEVTEAIITALHHKERH